MIVRHQRGTSNGPEPQIEKRTPSGEALFQKIHRTDTTSSSLELSCTTDCHCPVPTFRNGPAVGHVLISDLELNDPQPNPCNKNVWKRATNFTTTARPQRELEDDVPSISRLTPPTCWLICICYTKKWFAFKRLESAAPPSKGYKPM